MERDYFADDVDPASIEGDDMEAEAVAEVAEELTPEPEPEPAPAPVASASQSIGGIPTPPEMIPLETHAKSTGQYPTEDPGDDTTVWSPRPGIIGCNKQGFRKMRNI